MAKKGWAPYNLEKAATPWEGIIKIRNPQEPSKLLSFCRGEVNDWRFYQGTIEALKSMGDKDLNGILSFGTLCEADSMHYNSGVGAEESASSRIESTRKRLQKQFAVASGISSTVMDPDEDTEDVSKNKVYLSDPKWTLIPAYFPNERGEYIFAMEYNNTGLYLGQTECDLTHKDVDMGGGWGAISRANSNDTIMEAMETEAGLLLGTVVGDEAVQNYVTGTDPDDGGDGSKDESEYENPLKAVLRKIQLGLLPTPVVPRKACYMAFREGTTPLMLTKHKPALFKFVLDKKDVDEIQKTGAPKRASLLGLKMVGVDPKNDFAEYHYRLDLAFGFVRRTTGSILPGNPASLDDLLGSNVEDPAHVQANSSTMAASREAMEKFSLLGRLPDQEIFLEFSPPLYCEWMFPATMCLDNELGEYNFAKDLRIMEAVKGDSDARVYTEQAFNGIRSFLYGLEKTWESNLFEITFIFFAMLGTFMIYRLLSNKIKRESGRSENKQLLQSSLGNPNESWYHALFGSIDHTLSTTTTSDFNTAISEKVYADCTSKDFNAMWIDPEDREEARRANRAGYGALLWGSQDDGDDDRNNNETQTAPHQRRGRDGQEAFTVETGANRPREGAHAAGDSGKEV